MLNGKYLGYKGTIRESDGKVCVIELVFDKAKQDRLIGNAVYTRHCKVTRIFTKEGQPIKEVYGHAYKHFKYFVGQEIKGHRIYVFPVANGQTFEKAVCCAGNYAEQTIATELLTDFLNYRNMEDLKQLENFIMNVMTDKNATEFCLRMADKIKQAAKIGKLEYCKPVDVSNLVYRNNLK